MNTLVDNLNNISDRAGTVLNQLIRHYVESGTPVGSTTLAKSQELQVSSATVRNVRADLEQIGLIRAPHTSAGRIPTCAGYRVYINSMLNSQPLEAAASNQIQQVLGQYNDPKELI